MNGFRNPVVFRQKNKTPEIWDPVSGEIIPVNIYNRENDVVTVPVTLPPHGSQLFVFKKTEPKNHYSEIAKNDGTPPLLQFTKNGFLPLEDGEYKLTNENQQVSISNKTKTKTIDGSWEISFDKKWGAPEKVVFPELISWTESEIQGIKYYSGTATYRKSFDWYEISNSDKNRKIVLELGEVSKIAEIWLNGENLGITWTKPHWFDVTGKLKNGKNQLVVEVANTWSNRLTGDAVTGENFTNTNIRSTIIPAPSIETGDQTRVPWKNVPLIESGLLGPVKFLILNQFE